MPTPALYLALPSQHAERGRSSASGIPFEACAIFTYAYQHLHTSLANLITAVLSPKRIAGRVRCTGCNRWRDICRPSFLPCLVAAVVAVITLILSIIYVDETLPSLQKAPAKKAGEFLPCTLYELPCWQLTCSLPCIPELATACQSRVNACMQCFLQRLTERNVTGALVHCLSCRLSQVS